MADSLSRADALKEGVAKLASFRYLGHAIPVNLKYDAASDAEWTLRNGGVMSACDAQAGAEDGGPYTGLDRFGGLAQTLWKTAAATLIDTTYGRNRFGGVVWRRDALAHAGGIATEDDFFSYDALRQNTQHDRGDLAPPSGPPFTGVALATRQQRELRSFDETGNWLTDTTTSPALNQTRTHNKANETTGITGPTGVIDPAFDPVGNTTTMPKPGAWTTSCALTWDAWSRSPRRGRRQTVPPAQPEGPDFREAERRSTSRPVTFNDGV